MKEKYLENVLPLKAHACYLRNTAATLDKLEEIVKKNGTNKDILKSVYRLIHKQQSDLKNLSDDIFRNLFEGQ